ncbi:MAG: endoplasmic oxidoreductin-1 [Peltula sp. TS41687]|nr:MAG: endoplasmic oxidoreductin-1 [Peltula sp. TS41687]
MRSASYVFYLAVYALLGSTHAQVTSATGTSASNPDICAIEPGAIVSDACASYATLDRLNVELTPSLKSITQKTDFFAYYRLNLFNRVCPYWSDEHSMCGNIACAVNTLDNEEDIPEIWRASELGKLQGPKAEHPGRQQQEERQERPLQGELGEDVGESCVVEYDDECDDRDYCVPEDESASAKGDYVSLVDNPERFTGYAGPGARQVWDAIYRENCFSKTKGRISSPASRSSPFGQKASLDLKSVIMQHGRQQALLNNHAIDDGLEFDDECLEKRVFYRVISGMHASISTHLCWDYLNQTTGLWGPNLQCYETRLHSHPERISNLYFNYALVLRALAKLRIPLQNYTFCQGDVSQDRITKQKVLSLADKIASGPMIFDESLMFKDPAVAGLKDDFRNRFRNVSRLMDCVGCDKCRLWGKLQTAGYGTALKVLLEFDDDMEKGDVPQLRRTELVALVNTLDRISSSLTALGKFRKMIEAGHHGTPSVVIEGVDSAPKPHPLVSKKILTPDDLQYPDDDLGGHPIKKQRMSFSETFWDEWYRVWRAFRFVLRSWLNIPSVVFKIFVLETSRLWDWWLGLPIKPRAWEFHRLRPDEL